MRRGIVAQLVHRQRDRMHRSRLQGRVHEVERVPLQQVAGVQEHGSPRVRSADAVDLWNQARQTVRGLGTRVVIERKQPSVNVGGPHQHERFTAHADFLEIVELSIIRAAGPRRLACEDQPVIRLVIVLLLTCFVTFSAGAQEPVEPPVQQPVASADTAVISARGALVRSLVLPGWGQTYVGAPGRGAIYFAAEAGSLWMVYKARQQLRAARVLERHLLDTGVLPADQRLDLVLSRQAQQEDWITLAIFLLFFSGADAYVAAQLADFDERFGVRQSASGGVQLEARVPVGVRR
jgi:hypothetical protein